MFDCIQALQMPEDEVPYCVWMWRCASTALACASSGQVDGMYEAMEDVDHHPNFDADVLEASRG